MARFYIPCRCIQYAVARDRDPKIPRPNERLLQSYRQSRSIIFPFNVAELQQVCRNSVAVFGLKLGREELGTRE
jgi:hypothetical protein